MSPSAKDMMAKKNFLKKELQKLLLLKSKKKLNKYWERFSLKTP